MMKKSLKQKILNIQILFVCLVALISIMMGYSNFRETTQKHTSSMADMVAETCGLVINGDDLQLYKETGLRDSNYYEVWNKLIDYRNTNEDIVDLSVVWFDEDGCRYLFDTDLSKEGAFLGDRADYHTEQRYFREDLIKGKEIRQINYSDKIESYHSILSSFNIHMGYVVVGISTKAEKARLIRYMIQLIVCVLLVSALAAFFIVWKFSVEVITPINALSEAMSNYGKSIEKNEGKSSLDKLSIRTGDEIEDLYQSLRKMESDLLLSTSNLAVATWNSNHDSMTQLYNKRYLKEFLDQYEGKESIAIIYLDIDNLKQMNDVCGHEAGDQLIVKTAEFINSYQKIGATGFRMGGDEFLMVLLGRMETEIRQLVDAIKKSPGIMLTDENSPVTSQLSVGFAYSAGMTDVDELIEQADQSMYRDKNSHKHRRE